MGAVLLIGERAVNAAKTSSTENAKGNKQNEGRILGRYRDFISRTRLECWYPLQTWVSAILRGSCGGEAMMTGR